jgi:WD40 repeat protein
MSLSSSSSSSVILFASLKWNKNVYDFEFPKNSAGRFLKEKVYQLTQVPIERQKIMGKGAWKGMLKDDFDFATLQTDVLKLTLMGSAEVLAKPATTTTFVEDMTLEEQQKVEQKAYQESLASVTGMIPAMQTLPQHRAKDRHRQADEVYPYNGLVHGLPQYQIENLLKEQLQNQSSQDRSVPRLTGRVAMTLGLELQRAYVNDLTSLPDGTLLTGLEDGHVQLWKHGERIMDLIHLPAASNNSNRGVESVLAMQSNTAAAFATAGRGVVRVWTKDGDLMISGSTPFPYGSPAGLVQVQIQNESPENRVLCLAARFVVTPPPSNRPRLVPQDEAGRQRLAHIEAQEAVVDETISRLRRSIQLWYGNGSDDYNLHSTVMEAAAPVTALVTWNTSDATYLAAGDEQGGIQVWKMIPANEQPQLSKVQHYQLVSGSDLGHSSIVCMTFREVSRQLVVSTKTIEQPTSPVRPSDVASIAITTPASRGIQILNVNEVPVPSLAMTLDAHQDAASCLLPLPNGDLISAGGKHDATMKVWSNAQLSMKPTSARTVLSEPATTNLCKDSGYVFALTVLNDLKTPESPGRAHFAIAAARYNVVKLIV